MLYRYLERNVVLHFNNVMKTHAKDWKLVVDPKQESLEIKILAEDDSDDDDGRAPAAEPPTYVTKLVHYGHIYTIHACSSRILLTPLLHDVHTVQCSLVLLLLCVQYCGERRQNIVHSSCIL
jgi:hypothetical protein